MFQFTKNGVSTKDLAFAGKHLGAASLSALALAVITAFAPIASNAQTTSLQWAPGRLLVKPKPGLTDQEFDKALKVHGAKSIRKIPKIGVHVVQLPANASEKAIAALLLRNPNIKFAERDLYIRPNATSNDPYLTSQWHLTKIGATTAWDTATGQNITVAVLDTGVYAAHPDLQANLVAGWNVYDNNSDTADVHGHGTAVAGTIAAVTNNAVGVASVAGGAKVMPIRICDLTGSAYFSDMATGVIWAADRGAKVANLSFSGAAGSDTVMSAGQYLKNAGGLLIVAAGNEGTELTYTPSTSLVVVGATDSNDAKASFSSFGTFIDVSAPGVSIYTTNRSGSYSGWSGTSFATPVTAGTVALMMSSNPTLDPGTIENLLKSTAIDLGTAGWDKYFGYGRVNAASAVATAKVAVVTDTTAPNTAITSPAAGAVVKGLVSISASATDNIGVSRVDLSVNGATIASDTVAPYGFAWDSTTVPDGNATLTAYSYDAAGNYSGSSIVVKVANTVDTTPPVAAISNPGNGVKISGTVAVSANASDNVKVTAVRLYVDGKLTASSTSSSLVYSWNTKRLTAGTHTLKVEATDASGNIGTQTISVTK